MTLPLVTVDDLSGIASAPHNQPLTSSNAPINVEVFPSSEQDSRPQDIILRMYLRGTSPTEIASVLGGREKGWDSAKVMKVAETEWMQKRLTEIADRGEEEEMSVQNLFVSQSFRAVARLGQLVSSKNENTALGACRTILEYSVAPLKELKGEQRKRAMTDTEVRTLADQTRRQIEELQKKNAAKSA